MKFNCNVADMNKALQSIKKIMDVSKTHPYILVKVGDSCLNVCYSDGVHSYVEQIASSNDIDDLDKEIVIDFENLLKIVTNSISTSTLKTNPLEFDVNNDTHLMQIKVDKYITDGQMGGKLASSLTHSLAIENIEANPKKYGIVTRMDYTSIFDSENWDVWDRETLKNTIRVATPTDKDDRDSNIYFSVNDKEVKSRANLYVSMVKSPTIEEVAFAFKVSEASAINEIVSKFDSDVYVSATEDKKFVKLRNKDENCGLMIGIAPSQRADVKAFKTYEALDIKDIQVKVHKGAFEGVIQSIINATSDKDHVLKIVTTQDENGDSIQAINISVSTNGGSVKMDMNTVISAIRCADGIVPEDYTASIDIKTLKDIVSKCEYDWLNIGLSLSEDVIKLVDIAVKEESDGVLRPEEIARFYMIVSK